MVDIQQAREYYQENGRLTTHDTKDDKTFVIFGYLVMYQKGKDSWTSLGADGCLTTFKFRYCVVENTKDQFFQNLIIGKHSFSWVKI